MLMFSLACASTPPWSRTITAWLPAVRACPAQLGWALEASAIIRMDTRAPAVSLRPGIAVFFGSIVGPAGTRVDRVRWAQHHPINALGGRRLQHGPRDGFASDNKEWHPLTGTILD